MRGEDPGSAASALEKLVALREAGDITREEYDELKNNSIARMRVTTAPGGSS